MVGVFILVTLFYLVATPCLRQQQQQQQQLLLEQQNSNNNKRNQYHPPEIPIQDNHQKRKMGPIKNILIAIAMEDEAKPFIEHLNLQLIDTIFPKNMPFLAYTGIYNNDATITVIVNGKDNIYNTNVDNVGTVPASIAVLLALQQLPLIDIVINAGTCGGFSKHTTNAQIGDVYITSSVANHDRRIPIPPFIPYGIGTIECTITKSKEIQDFVSNENYKLGICTTGNSLDHTNEDDIHMNNNDASVKDMEAAAIAWTCSLFNKNIPFVGVKVVTDIVDGPHATQDEFLQNLHTASQRLQESLPKIVSFITGKEFL